MLADVHIELALRALSPIPLTDNWGAMQNIKHIVGPALASLTLICSAMACSAGQKRPVVATALDDREMRHESLEATLRVLDQHPEYVDEMFQLSLRHPAMLDRLLHDTALHLEDEAFARRVARHLADSPAGLRTTLVATLDEVEHRPDARKAAAQAIAQRPDQTVQVMVQSDATVRSTVRALIQRVQRDENARRSFLQAMDENRKGTAAVLVTDSEVLMNLFKEVGNVGVKRGKNELQAFLEAVDD
jgi:hypothetical protein